MSYLNKKSTHMIKSCLPLTDKLSTQGYMYMYSKYRLQKLYIGGGLYGIYTTVGTDTEYGVVWNPVAFSVAILWSLSK